MAERRRSAVRRLWHAIRIRWLALLIFLVFWIASWVVTARTWEIDAGGYSVGMNPVAISLHLVLPFAVGLLVGGWRGSTLRPLWKACALTGLLFSAIHLAVMGSVDLLWLPAVEPRPDLPGAGAAEWFFFGLFYAGICVVLSVIGGSVAWAAAALLRRGHLKSGPAHRRESQLG